MNPGKFGTRRARNGRQVRFVSLGAALVRRETDRRRAFRTRASRFIALALGVVLAATAVPRALAGPSGPGVPADSSPLPPLRSERLALASGAEIITIFGASDAPEDIPLVALLNDTLGDGDPANDRLRYVWVFSYCPPPVWRQVLASVPFNYHRFPARRAGVHASDPPPIIFDLARRPESAWRRVLWYLSQVALLDPMGWLVHAGSRTYARNEREYRRTHLEKGLWVLAAYRDSNDDAPELADERFEELYGSVLQGGFGGLFLSDRHLSHAYTRDAASSRKHVSKNYELLRQRCEEEGLWFEPLPGPPARAQHAIVWVSAEDVAESPRRRKFNSRFLNIANPWTDDRLRDWEGYSKVCFVAPDGRISHEPEVESRPVRMIPLAIYGLDFPKIPAVLVDLRSVFNPKRREISRRAIDDVGRFLVDASPFGDLKYYATKKLFALITGRKGIDVYQPSRAHSYAQLRSLLILSDILEPELQQIVRRDLERININPLGNNLEGEAGLALAQYRALMGHAEDGGLDRRVERDRGEEMARLAHGRTANVLLRVAHYATLGLYRHRDDSPELRELYATARALERHALLLGEVASAPSPIEISWAPEKFRPALEYVTLHGEQGGAALARACEAIARKSGDSRTRFLAVDALHRIDHKVAREALTRVADDPDVAQDLRDHCSRLLGRAGGAPAAWPDDVPAHQLREAPAP
jgi:hypothetical protein